MNLKKKTSIWKYIMRLDSISSAITVIVVAAMIFTLPLSGRLGYFIFSSVVSKLFNMSVHKPSFVDYIIAGLCVDLAIAWLFVVLICIIDFVKKHIIILSILRAAVYIPLSKDELEENGIHTMDDMTEFLKSNVFKDVRHGVRVNEIFPELKACYSLVYCDNFKDDMSEEKKKEKRAFDLYKAADSIIEWLDDYDEKLTEN